MGKSIKKPTAHSIPWVLACRSSELSGIENPDMTKGFAGWQKTKVCKALASYRYGKSGMMLVLSQA